MEKKVYVVVEGGNIIKAFSSEDIEVVVYNLDTEDLDERAELRNSIESLQACFIPEVKIV